VVIILDRKLLGLLPKERQELWQSFQAALVTEFAHGDGYMIQLQRVQMMGLQINLKRTSLLMV